MRGGNNYGARLRGQLGDVLKGDSGKSAYEIAVEHGYTGTESEWIAYVEANGDQAYQYTQEAATARDEAVAARSGAIGAKDAAAASAVSAGGSAAQAQNAATIASQSAGNAGASEASAREYAQAASSCCNAAQAASREAETQALRCVERADEARDAQIRARESELLVAEKYVEIMGAPETTREYARQAEASATAAGASALSASGSAEAASSSAEAAAGSAESAANSLTDINTGLASKLGKDETAVNAEKVNNHTVESDVPANAVFTDTTYEKMTSEEATAGTSTTGRIITAKVLADRIAEAIAALVDSSPTTLDTLNELATALGDDPNFATTMATALAEKLGKTETAVNAEKVNNLTVETAVPANAVFTDTTYTDFVGSGSSAAAGLVPAPATTAGTTKYLREDGTWQVPPDTNTTYSNVTTSAAGLMSAEDKTKLNSIASGAQVNSITGVKGDNEADYRTGNVNITKGNIGLGNVDNTADSAKSVSHAATAGNADTVNNLTVQTAVPANAVFTDTTYDTMSAQEATTGTDTTGKLITAKVLADYVAGAIASLVASAPGTLDTLNELAAALGNDPNFATTMATALGNKLGKTETAVNAEKVNNLTVLTAVPANAKFTDTTYSTFVKSGSTAAAGLVPKPSTTAGSTKYLREDGTWAVPPDNNTTYSNFVGSGSGAAAGLVPSPSTTAGTAKYLREDGTWQVPPDNNTTYTAASATPLANGTAAVGTSAKYAREDHVHPLQTSVSGSSGSCTGNAATATKLATARTINIQDSSATNTGTGASFDGSGNATIKLPATIKADVTGNCSGSSGSCTGNAATASKAAQLTTARTIDGVSFNGTANITHYGSCSTAAATVEKTVACTGFTLATGARIAVKFTVTNTAANPTLNVQSTGAKAIYYRGAAISAGYLAANRTYTFIYNGTQYELVGDLNTDTNNATAQNISTTNATYPILLGNTANATANIGNKAALFGSGVKVNPSTSEVIATKFTGALNGTANKATNDSDGNSIKDTYLKLAGGQMTGTLYLYKDTSSANGTYQRGDTITSTKYWSTTYRGATNSSAVAGLWCAVTPEGTSSLVMRVYKAQATSSYEQFGLFNPVGGDPYTAAPHPPADDDSKKIATTGWVMSLLRTKGLIS